MDDWTDILYSEHGDADHDGVERESQRQIGGDPDPYHDTALLLTSGWLIWARSGPKSGTMVSAARLQEAEVAAFNSQLIPDSGLEVITHPPGTTEAVTAFVPLAADRVDPVLALVRAAGGKAP